MNKIRGNVVGTPMKRPDFNQTDPKKSDYILNNPLPILTEEDEGKILLVRDGKLVAIRNSFVEGEGLSIKTINGGKLKFFVGTEEEYKALPEEEKENLFALFTDDTSQAEFDTLKSDVAELQSGAMTLYGGTKIIEGDLNDYITEGNYYIQSNDEMKNVAHTPTPNAGILKVLSGLGAKSTLYGEWKYLVQIFITHNCEMFIRHYYQGSWCTWKQFAGDGSHATTAGHATTADLAGHATTADTAGYATTAGHSTTSGRLRGVDNNLNETNNYAAFQFNRNSDGKHRLIRWNMDGTSSSDMWIRYAENADLADFASESGSVKQNVKNITIYANSQSINNVSLGDGCYIFTASPYKGTYVLWVKAGKSTVSSLNFVDNKHVAIQCTTGSDSLSRLTLVYYSNGEWTPYSEAYDVTLSFVPITKP